MRAAMRVALAAASPQPGAPSAWMRRDGDVISAKKKGEMLFEYGPATAGKADWYSIPLYAGVLDPAAPQPGAETEAITTTLDQIDAERIAEEWLMAMAPNDRHRVFWQLDRLSFAPHDGRAMVLRSHDRIVAAALMVRDDHNRTNLIKFRASPAPAVSQGLIDEARELIAAGLDYALDAARSAEREAVTLLPHHQERARREIEAIERAIDALAAAGSSR